MAVTTFFSITSSLFIAPAFGSPRSEEDTEPPSTRQSLIAFGTSPQVALESFEFEVEPEPAPLPRQNTVYRVSIAPAPGNGSAGLLWAARAQLGIAQDCTAMVENALRALGYGVGDLGPMGFAGYGYQVSPDQAQPGDIMMRGGHVAIYAGNGVAVHGGFNGSTVETSIDGSPYNYAIIIRL